MPVVICKDDPKYHLGVEVMDKTHAEFIDFVHALTIADKPQFIPLFKKFVAHTREHFEQENALMQEYCFPAIEEHISEHTRILRDITLMGERVNKGIAALAKAFITDQASDWFHVHATTMDTALSLHIISQQNASTSTTLPDICNDVEQSQLNASA